MTVVQVVGVTVVNDCSVAAILAMLMRVIFVNCVGIRHRLLPFCERHQAPVGPMALASGLSEACVKPLKTRPSTC